MTKDCDPRLVRVTVCGELVVPIACGPNMRSSGDTAPASGAFPDKLTSCGLPPALYETLSAADRVFGAVGVKVTLISHAEPTASDDGQLFVSAKSVELAP